MLSWYKKLSEQLKTLGMIQLTPDPGAYSRGQGEDLLLMTA